MKIPDAKNIIFILISISSLVGYPLVAILSSLLAWDSSIPAFIFRFSIVIACIFYIFKYFNYSYKIYLINLLVYLFFLAYLTRIIFDAFIFKNQLSYDGSYYLIWFMGASLLPFIIITNGNAYKNFNLLFKTIYISCLISVALLILLSSNNVFDVQNNVIIQTDRLQISKLNPISLGNLGYLLAILAIHKLKYINDSSSFISLAAFLMGLYIGFGSASKGPLISFIIILLIFVFYNYQKKRFALYLFILFSLIFINYIQLIEILNLDFLNRFYDLYNGLDQSSLSRIISMSGAMHQFIDNPVFGNALEENITHFYPHNSLVEAFMATGIFFGAIYFLVMIILFRKSLSLIKSNENFSWIALLWVFFFIESMFSGSICFGNEFWIITALLISLDINKNKFVNSLNKIAPNEI